MDLKKLEKLEAQIQASPVQDSRSDAACVKVASSLTFCAHGSLQSFSKSDKKKRPKTDPPGGTTFDPKRVHFWTPFERHLLCARVQNWCLDILNPVPPWGLFDAHSNTLLNRVVRIKLHISTSHMT